MLQQTPDHIAVTGDLVNLGLKQEYRQALDWLETLGEANKISVVPGNHDAYLSSSMQHAYDQWAPYMNADAQSNQSNIFPYVRPLDEDIVLIGLSSAVPTPFFVAAGTMGEEQLERFSKIINHYKEKYFPIILIHHPPLPDMTKPSRALTDAEDLRSVLRQLNAGLVLHGHNHQNSNITLKTETGQVSVIGVPSASCGKSGKEPLARYNLFEIKKLEGGWSCVMTGKGLETENGDIKELERVKLF